LLGNAPFTSEQVGALALRECLPEFIAGFRKTNSLAKTFQKTSMLTGPKVGA
jgi:hypothetical protein